MDKNAIKKFAVWARTELIARVSLKGVEYGITEKKIEDANVDSVGGKVLTADEKKQRQALIAEINDKGYKQVMEEVAYTWFNRFSALRFMEVNGYLPSHVRVFTDEENNFKPQIITEAIHLDLDGLNMEKVYELKDAEKTEELYKYLLIVQCNALNKILPGMFQKIADCTELLLPDNLLREGSVIQQMIELIPEDDWKDAVQIIGWLYQYYNSEKKDDVFAALKKNVKITKENIPAATQLFTPDWIVRYMVENSLGRLWLEGHPDVKEQLLPTEEEQSAYAAGNRDPEDTKWHYYLEEAEQEPEVQAQLAEIRKEYAALTPDQLKVIDPCSGSGHILAYMFDVLMKIYESYGYTTREAVASIVENNLYGLDIDDRAAQLAYFAVMMKARQYDRRFFSRGIQPHVYAIVESNHVDEFAVDYFCNGNAKLTAAMDTIISELHDAKEYGSILSVTPQDWSALYGRFAEISEDINMSRETALRELLPLVQVAEALAQKYETVVTNPPYMGASNMNPKLNEFIKNNYADYKSDFFSAFVIHASQMTKQSGYCGFFTPYVWMFIQSYEKMRNYLYNQATIETLIQFEYSAFEEATVPVCTFAFQNRHIPKKGCYLRLVDFRGGMEVQQQKTLEAIENHNCGFYYAQNADNFSEIPGNPMAYWVKNFKIFEFQNLSSMLRSGGRIKTHDNNLYVRNWWEVYEIGDRWIPYTNGGEYRKWYGDYLDVVDWSEKAREFYGNHGGLCKEIFWFKEGLTWGAITSGDNSYRIKPKQFMFSSASPTVFTSSFTCDMSVLAFLNTKVAKYISKIINPTLNQNVNDTLRIPYYGFSEKASNCASKCIEISKIDWDAFETSWDFQHHPLLRKVSTIAGAFDQWQTECDDRFNQLKANEEELNRIFIDIYGLQDELTPEVEDKDVTVRKADLGRDIRSFISYAVGCMFGRYSLDVDGLAYAGGEWDSSKYVSYAADKDNIIPICDDEYFEDDIVGLFVKFVKTVYGADTLDENLKFIADALGGKGQPKDVIRNYFLSDFYSDHCKIYQKRPIYWLFDSGKKNGFKALIYMHRYQPDTIARIRTDYVHEQQARYRTALANLEQRIANASTGERVKLNRKLTTLQAQDTEIRTYEEKIHHLADQIISIDLDDGVKKNYAIFQDVLAKIK
ncbi:BREX-1 system adenine-specific DNA-methyltransferase PglX [Agathobacter rectalis]|uniref:site-specific DNA-methyltransferase (adenine-specific) n=1 Tax=Agathobacter rectalis TaxID=39491 RepID=A0A414I0Y2_9FIRM|nr:BREX-1 system adenine-specific DNA-methyltransferase PglX [Agathobacter rectalis]RHD97436.1 BREX-1 system adenine-specific DNA-methyltransferase PglX [Agathobacter rectalis]